MSSPLFVFLGSRPPPLVSYLSRLHLSFEPTGSVISFVACPWCPFRPPLAELTFFPPFSPFFLRSIQSVVVRGTPLRRPSRCGRGVCWRAGRRGCHEATSCNSACLTKRRVWRRFFFCPPLEDSRRRSSARNRAQARSCWSRRRRAVVGNRRPNHPVRFAPAPWPHFRRAGCHEACSVAGTCAAADRIADTAGASVCRLRRRPWSAPR